MNEKSEWTDEWARGLHDFVAMRMCMCADACMYPRKCGHASAEATPPNATCDTIHQPTAGPDILSSGVGRTRLQAHLVAKVQKVLSVDRFAFKARHLRGTLAGEEVTGLGTAAMLWHERPH
eukprot:222123-Chlamydomonas_euryale.AAC.2